MGCYHWATVKHPHVTYHRSNYNPSYLLCPVSSSTGLACSLPLFRPLLRSSRHGHGIIPSLVVSAVNARIPWRLCLNHHGDHLAVVKDDYVELWCTCGEKDFLVAAGNCASEWILTVCCVHLVLVSIECRAVLLVPALAIALIVHLCSLYSPLHLTFFFLPTPLLLPTNSSPPPCPSSPPPCPSSSPPSPSPVVRDPNPQWRSVCWSSQDTWLAVGNRLVRSTLRHACTHTKLTLLPPPVTFTLPHAHHPSNS